MRVFLVLLVSIFPGANTISCPDLYTDGGDGSCYNGNIGSNSPRGWAYERCAEDNAYITDVSNGFQNTAIANNFGSVDFGWLGLTCLNNSVTSCTWDNGIPMTSSSYSNFDAGHPIPQTGPCVVMAVKTGKWYSADCSNTDAYFGCKYTPNVNVPSCASYFTAFHGKCYCTIAVNSTGDATWYCSRDFDAVQTSIHSDGENAFVKGLATRYNYLNWDVRQNQLFLGIQQNRTWTDGTAEDYDNYGYKNSALGSCTSMSLYDDLVPAGMWISSQCSANSGFYAFTVCKKDPVEPTQAPTMAPPQCSGTQFLSGYGTVYSPSYPLGSEPNHCEFLITEDDGYQAQITLKYLQLDRNSTIQLFSGLFDKTPFQTLTNTNFYSQTYRSPSNVLKIVYDTAGSENNKNLWTGDYQPRL